MSAVLAERQPHYQWQLTQLPPDQMAAILAQDIFKCIFLNAYEKIPIEICSQESNWQ